MTMIALSELSAILLFKRVQHHSPVHGRPVTAIEGNDPSARPRSQRERVLPGAFEREDGRAISPKGALGPMQIMPELGLN
jgi:hypothetical protein